MQRSNMDFCQFFKQKRRAIGTVREFAKDNGYDVAYISRLEKKIIVRLKEFLLEQNY